MKDEHGELCPANGKEGGKKIRGILLRDWVTLLRLMVDG